MPPIGASRQFEIVTAVLALAEERGAIPLAEAAAIVGVPVVALRELLDPVLYLEFRDASGDLIMLTNAFLLDEHDVLQVDTGHWLRDWDAAAPSRDAALRLLVAATVYQAAGDVHSPALDRALEKLRQLVAIEMVLPVDRPPCLEPALHALREGRSLRFRYVKWKDDVATDREVLPWDVFGLWGHWYVYGPEVGTERAKQWRVDRMDAAEMGTVAFDAPSEVTRPEWFDLSAERRRVTVRVPVALLAALPQPHTVVSRTEAPDGTVTAELEVAGDRQLDHLLVALGPDGEVVAPEAYARRRRERAHQLLGT